nr:peptidoglycan editing factor PgeF [Tissierella sp.]
MAFVKNQDGELVYYTIESFQGTELVNHGFSTRLGGVSKGDLTSLNLGMKKNEPRKNKLDNYKIFTKSLGINLENLVLTDQVHKDNILEVDESDRGKGLIKESDIKGIDGFITNKRNVALVTFYADCVPVFLLDPINKSIGLVHAGWKGTVSRIGEKTLKRMMQTYGTDPKDVLIAIGPSIGKCCFEVGGEVIEIIKENFEQAEEYFNKKDNGKFMLDLWNLNKDQFLEMGVLEDNITLSNICTMCNKDIFFSHRGDHGKTGSLAAIMELK